MRLTRVWAVVVGVLVGAMALPVGAGADEGAPEHSMRAVKLAILADFGVEHDGGNGLGELKKQLTAEQRDAYKAALTDHHETRKAMRKAAKAEAKLDDAKGEGKDKAKDKAKDKGKSNDKVKDGDDELEDDEPEDDELEDDEPEDDEPKDDEEEDEPRDDELEDDEPESDTNS